LKKVKVKIEVFVPLGSCICNFAPFMERIGRVTSRFKDVTEVQVKSSKSSEASKHGVQDMGIVINGKIKLSASFDEKDLERAILKAISY
jgi:ribosome-associated translation inhibitor RaiA